MLARDMRIEQHHRGDRRQHHRGHHCHPHPEVPGKGAEVGAGFCVHALHPVGRDDSGGESRPQEESRSRHRVERTERRPLAGFVWWRRDDAHGNPVASVPERPLRHEPRRNPSGLRRFERRTRSWAALSYNSDEPESSALSSRGRRAVDGFLRHARETLVGRPKVIFAPEILISREFFLERLGHRVAHEAKSDAQIDNVRSLLQVFQ